jgi:hypothetical protein
MCMPYGCITLPTHHHVTKIPKRQVRPGENDGNGPNSGRFSKGAGEGTPKTRRAAAMEVEEVDVR